MVSFSPVRLLKIHHYSILDRSAFGYKANLDGLKKAIQAVGLSKGVLNVSPYVKWVSVSCPCVVQLEKSDEQILLA